MDLTRSAYSAHVTTDPTITPMHTLLQYQAYRLPPSEYLYVEGIPADLRGPEIPELIQHIAAELQIPLNQAAANNQFATTLSTGHHNYFFGHHHGPNYRLAVRIFPCGFNRPETMHWN